MDSGVITGIVIGIVVIILGLSMSIFSFEGYEKAGVLVALLGVSMIILSHKLGKKIK